MQHVYAGTQNTVAVLCDRGNVTLGYFLQALTATAPGSMALPPSRKSPLKTSQQEGRHYFV